jgi:hypothetical protein
LAALGLKKESEYASVEAYLTERSRFCGENRDRFRKDNDEERHRDLDGPHDGLFGLLINLVGDFRPKLFSVFRLVRVPFGIIRSPHLIAHTHSEHPTGPKECPPAKAGDDTG